MKIVCQSVSCLFNLTMTSLYRTKYTQWSKCFECSANCKRYWTFKSWGLMSTSLSHLKKTSTSKREGKSSTLNSIGGNAIEVVWHFVGRPIRKNGIPSNVSWVLHVHVIVCKYDRTGPTSPWCVSKGGVSLPAPMITSFRFQWSQQINIF